MLDYLFRLALLRFTGARALVLSQSTGRIYFPSKLHLAFGLTPLGYSVVSINILSICQLYTDVKSFTSGLHTNICINVILDRQYMRFRHSGL